MKKVMIPILAILLGVSCQNPAEKNKNRREELSEVMIAAKLRNNDTVTVTKTMDLKRRLETPVNPRVIVHDRTTIQPDLSSIVENFITDKNDAVERDEVRNRITQVISETYGLSEFRDEAGNYVVYEKIRPIISKSMTWQRIGAATDQNAIDRAQEHTNNGGLSLIIDTAASYGHVVMLLPGEMSKSNAWDMNLPNVLSLLNYRPEHSFHGKSVSYAFKKSDDLQVYIEKKY